jgi:hypothetical protein
MKAPIAQAGGEAASPPGGLCLIIFFLGPRNRKMHFSRISAGSRFLVILSDLAFGVVLSVILYVLIVARLVAGGPERLKLTP